MFGVFTRTIRINKAIGAAEQMLREFIASEAAFRTIPSSVYEDPYVWGYLASVTMHWIDLVHTDAVHYKFSNEEKARIARGAIIAVAGMGLKRYVAIRDTLAGKETLAGMHQASKMVGVMSGQLGPADDPEVAEVFEGARRLLPNESTAGAAAGMLKRHHLGQRIDSILDSTEG